MRKIELHPAHLWTCDDCGRDNFCRALNFDITPDRAAEIAAETGLDVEDYAGVVETVIPKSVTCTHCGAEFATEFPHASKPHD